MNYLISILKRGIKLLRKFVSFGCSLINSFKSLSKRQKIIIGIGSFVAIVLVIIGMLMGFYLYVLWGGFGKLPDNEALTKLKNYQASEIYTADSVLIGRFFVENRSEAKFDEISPFILDALVATEDARFYEHQGVDHYSLIRVLFRTIILRQKAGGGSTLSQQLIKNVYGRKRYGFLTMPVVKIKESVLANRLEQLYSKQEILTLYLNTVSFGEDTYGIKTACERFFSSSPKNIEPENAALLIGMLKAPTLYSPRKNKARSMQRRNVVLAQMEKYDFIDEELKKELQSKDVQLRYNKLNEDAFASHFKEMVRLELEKWTRDYNETLGKDLNIFTDGLKIYTTIRYKLQSQAEKSLIGHLNALQKEFNVDLKLKDSSDSRTEAISRAVKQSKRFKNFIGQGISENQALDSMRVERLMSWVDIKGRFKDTLMSVYDSILQSQTTLQGGFCAVDPRNGKVLAYVGGRNFFYSQYDHVQSKRQIGSIFKPIVYAKALETGRRPCSYVSNRKISYAQYDDWTPRNANDQYEGRYSLTGGLVQSVNTITVKLAMEAGLSNVISFAHRLGIGDSLSPSPAVCLGVDNINLKDVLGVYSSFANAGVRSEIQSIEKIVSQEGEVLYEFEPEQKEVLNEQIAYDLTRMLQAVVQRGTGARIHRLYHIQQKIAGKTGTTQNHSDGWFVGYTPSYLAGVWVGHDNPSIHFSNIAQGQGGYMALPIWASVYKTMMEVALLSDHYQKEFNYLPAADCEDYKEDTKFLKLFKKPGVKKNNATGFEKSKLKRKGLKFFKKRKD